MVANLKKLRIENNYSQQKLAELVGVSQQSINKYENHNVEPDISTLIALAKQLNTTIDYLVGIDDLPPTDNTRELLNVFDRLSIKEQKIYIEQGKAFYKAI